MEQRQLYSMIAQNCSKYREKSNLTNSCQGEVVPTCSNCAYMINHHCTMNVFDEIKKQLD